MSAGLITAVQLGFCPGCILLLGVCQVGAYGRLMEHGTGLGARVLVTEPPGVGLAAGQALARFQRAERLIGVRVGNPRA